MFKLMRFFTLLISALLAGCDGSKQEVAVKKEVGSASTNSVSATALYLPGGGGIDFGKNPVSKKDTLDEASRTGSMTINYEFDYPVELVAREIDAEMISQGYISSAKLNDRYKKYYSYTKASKGVVFAYNDFVASGLKKKTNLMIWWR